VSTSVVKWSEGLSNSVSTIITRYVYHMKFDAYMAFSINHIVSYSFGSIFYHCIYIYMFACFVCFCLILYILYFYCYVCSVYSIPLCCSVYCLCANVYCTTATGCQPNYS